MSDDRTAWHSFLGLLLQEKAPSDFEVRAEEPLTRSIQHMDWLILRRRPGPSPPTMATTLVELWPELPAVTLAEFKSFSKGYRPRDLHRLIGYGHQYFSVSVAEVSACSELALVLIVAERNARLTRDSADLGLRERPWREGYTWLDGLAFPTLLIDLTALAERVRNDYIALFTKKAPLPPGATEWWYAHFGPRKEGTMDPTKLEGFEEMRRRVIQATPIEDRLAGLTPEQIAQKLGGVEEMRRRVLQATPIEDRLAGLTPEQIAQKLGGVEEMRRRVLQATPIEDRLAGLSRAEQLLALPPDLLQQLPEDYIASLPTDVQTRVRARRGR